MFVTIKISLVFLSAIPLRQYVKNACKKQNTYYIVHIHSQNYTHILLLSFFFFLLFSSVTHTHILITIYHSCD